MLNATDPPDDIAALKALLVAAEARNQRKDERIERLEKLVAAFPQAAFGHKPEKRDSSDAPRATRARAGSKRQTSSTI